MKVIVEPDLSHYCGWAATLADCSDVLSTTVPEPVRELSVHALNCARRNALVPHIQAESVGVLIDMHHVILSDIGDILEGAFESYIGFMMIEGGLHSLTGFIRFSSTKMPLNSVI